MNIARIANGKITDENDKFYFAQVDGQTFAIEKEQIGHRTFNLGDLVEGFIYQDMNHKDRLQLNPPQVRPGQFGWGKVTQVRKDLGVFVDIGLFQKDLVVSLDDLPENKEEWPQKGDRLFLTMTFDKKGRYWGELATFDRMAEEFIKAPARLMNQEIEVTIFQIKPIGVVAISEENFRVFIHENEWILPPRLGQQIKGRVIKVHADGSLNLSLKPRAHEAISDDAIMILRILEKKPNGFLALHDKSDPDIIKRELGISKGQFKRAIGSLLKNKQIRQEVNQGIYLMDHD